MLAACVALSLAAAPAAASSKPVLALMGLAAAGGVEAGVADSLSEAVAAEAARAGYFQVTSQKDMQTMLGLERQKQLMGCSDASSTCMTELAGALGARFVLTGSVTRLGDAYQLNLQTVDTAKAQPLGRATRIANDLKALRDQIPFALADATATPPPVPPSRVPTVTLIGVGAAAIVASGVLFLMSITREQAAQSELTLAMQQPQLQLKPASYYRGEAQAVVTSRIIASVLAGVGVAGIVVGIVLNPSSGGGSRIALVPTFDGAALAGVFP
jgi:TolB-like protein